MGVQVTLLALTITLGTVVVACLWRALSTMWLRPNKIERCLRQQGLRGNSFRFLYGDLKDSIRAEKEATSKAINLAEDILPRLLPFIHHSIKKHGKYSFLWIGSTAWINIMEPEQIKEAFTKIRDFQKPVPNPLVVPLGTGLTSYEGDRWAKHRRLMNPAYHADKLKNMVPAIYLSCSETLSRWETLVSDEGWCELDVWPEVQNMMRDVLCRTAFGASNEQGKRVFEIQKEMADLALQLMQTLYIPGWRFLPTKTNRRMRKLDREIQATFQTIISKKEKAMQQAGQAGNDDLLGILVKSNLQEIEEHKNNKKAGLTLKEVMEECKLFYFSGHETTSSLLIWTLILLSINQDWQERARDEVQKVMGEGKPDWNMLSHLKIVMMILNEVLRLYPPVALVGRTVSKETKLGKLTLPAGVRLSVPILSIHHDQELWGDDAKEFNPARFSEGVSKATKGRVTFLPFGCGPRVCIAQNFAVTEAKMALAMMLQRFSFKLSPSYTHAPHTVIVVQPQHGAHLILQKL